ncbi:alkaline phosphatase PhoX [Engelhardtia mirabilis]|uniref:Phytase-like domain-containing protein n=1 Tax=Engelhardtia mirabilis TaxID=2528011 RepID=A0A518BG79_9BACT|nr:hypothetical protein Pla133_09890 [Planctomycetes bacterium Pla133]QDV00249.1 hypothetical protein Pla86_09880 [Planctomycetes bacterium Pla86]
MLKSQILVLATIPASASIALGQTFPLPATAGDTTPTEATAPFLTPTSVIQTLITDRDTLTPLGLPASFSNWDMVAFDETSRFVFIPAEVSSGAGVFRYDTQDGTFEVLLEGNGSGVRESDPLAWSATNDDYARLDPATLTPWGSVLTGEETTGGRLFEILDPKSATPTVVWRSNIPAVGHEGLRLGAGGEVYFVDEDNSGSLYKFVPKVAGDLSVGQSFVLSVDAFAADSTVDASANWDNAANLAAARFGAASWVALTDADGVALTTADPFAFVNTTGGRTAADELVGTPYGRPEDLAVGFLANGNEVVYCTLTSENRVLSIELTSADTAFVREFVNFDTIDLATGLDVNPTQNEPTTSPGPDSATNFDDPDNLAIDAFGSIYILEDEGPGDIWKCVDADGDGVAEGMGIFASLGVDGSEPTGLLADPNDPYRFIVCIQHPSSGNDALWQLDAKPYPAVGGDLALRTGVNGAPNAFPGEFVKAAVAGDVATLEVASPAGSLELQPFALLAQGVVPGTVQASPFFAGLWLDALLPVVTLDGALNLINPVNLPLGGSSVDVVIPAGLAGISIVVQGVSLAASGIVFTDAHELVIEG